MGTPIDYLCAQYLQNGYRKGYNIGLRTLKKVDVDYQIHALAVKSTMNLACCMERTLYAYTFSAK